MAKTKQQSFLQGALILSVAAILVKIIGALFKIPLQMMIGQVGYGYFDVAYQFYVPIYTIATAGLPVAVSRLVSENMTLGNYRHIGRLYRVALKLFLVTGTVGTLIMLIGSFFYPQYIGAPGSFQTMLVMSPAIFFCCLVSAHRGLYEGTRNMYPTAISQVIEALGKLILGLAFAYGMILWGQKQYASSGVVFGQVAAGTDEALSLSLPYVAAGAMLGITCGSMLAFVYMMLYHRKRGDGVTKEMLATAPKAASSRSLFKSLMRVAIPIALGSLATQLTNLIDSVSLQKCLEAVIAQNGDVIRGMYGNLMNAAGVADTAEGIQMWLTGNRGYAMTYVNLIPNITLTLGISALPVVTSAWALHDRKQLKSTVESVLRITLLIALPCGAGFAMLGEPLMYLIYGQTFVSQAVGPLLAVLGFAVIFICLTAPINALLQAVGRADIPLKIILVGGAVKLLLNLWLIQIPTLNVMGSAYSTLACYAVIVVLSIGALCREVRIRMKWKSVLIKPLFAAILCGAAAFASNGLIAMALPKRLSTIAAVGIAVIVYAISLLFMRVLTKDDIFMLPKGEKIAKILEKRGWIG